MNLFIFGSSIVSSYWNGAATYYRGIYKHLAQRGHSITFAEPNAYGRQQHLDEGDYSYVESIVYRPGMDIPRMLQLASGADVIIKHSGLGVDDERLEATVPELRHNSAVFFWDVDAPSTLGRVEANSHDPFRKAIPCYDAILTYGGGPSARNAYHRLGARAYYSIYNGLDPDTHYPVAADGDFACDLVFVGNRLPDREARVDELFFRAAKLAPKKKFLLGGEGWGDKPMPKNVRWIGHVPTHLHNRVNCSASMVLNVNRSSMADFGFSPPTRIFEVAGAGACMVCDRWPGLSACFEPGSEILTATCAEDVAEILNNCGLESRAQVGRAFRARALRDHTYSRRAEQAESAFLESIAAVAADSVMEPVKEAA